MENKRTVKGISIRVVLYIILILLALSFLYPLFFTFVNSIKSQSEYMTDPFSIKLVGAYFENYWLIFKNFNIGRYFGNTLLITVLRLAFSMPLSIFAAYAFAKLKFRGKAIMKPAVMVGMFIPFQVIMIPMYVMLAKVRLINTVTGLVLVTGTLAIPGNVLLLSANFSSIPKEMLEAASLDGCGYFRRIWNVIVPMGKPAISICVIMGFIGSWNDLLAPMVILKDISKQMIMPGLNNLVSVFAQDIPFQLTGMLMASVPAILVYIILQKQIIMGISASSVK